jgi:Tfp pilus assembly protein PilO
LKITAREKRYIILGAVVAAAVLVFYVFSLLLEDSADISKKLEQKKETYRRQLEILNHKPVYDAQLDLYKRQLQTDLTRLIPGDNPNVAVSELGKMLEDFANQSGVEINSKSPQPDKRVDDKLVRVSVQIQTTCVMEQLVQFLASIENCDKFLAVTDLNVYGSFRNPGFGTNQRRNEIRPMLTVSGYINAPAPKSKPSTEGSSGAPR